MSSIDTEQRIQDLKGHYQEQKSCSLAKPIMYMSRYSYTMIYKNGERMRVLCLFVFIVV